MSLMLAIFLSILALVILLFISEAMGRKKILGPELKRKFYHIISGSFIAFWPYWMSWRAIEILALVMLIGVTANYWLNIFNFTKGIGRRSYGDAFLALAIFLVAALTDSRLFFTLAILNVSLADGLAALVGKRFGKNWPYKVFGQQKTVVGTMAFWLVSLGVAGSCLLFDSGQLHFSQYVWLIIILPPLMAAFENFSHLGIDNLTVPLAAIVLLRLIS